MFFFFLTLLVWGSALAQEQVLPESLLLTAFEPFGGSPTNNSQAIAEQTKAHLAKVRPSLHVELCVLPVEYDRAAQVALHCLAAMATKPKSVLSLGEAACKIKLETIARNLDDDFMADNAGLSRQNQPIVLGDKEQIGFNASIAKMYCSLSTSKRNQILLSHHAGSYVCNNTAYHLAKRFDPLDTKFSFVHVPNSSCSPAQRDPKANGEIISAMALAMVDAPKEAEFPTNKEEFATFSASLKAANPVDACTDQFLTLSAQFFE